MKKFIFTSIVTFLIITNLFCQPLETNDASVPPITIESMVQKLVGSGIEITDFSFDGVPEAVGIFEYGNNAVGLQNGIVLTTGRVASQGSNFGADAVGQDFASTGNGSTAQDSDLSAIGNGTVNDAAVLTISFIPTGDSIRFRYVFASEEYPEWSCSQFNDVFGFFISGPGINGSFENNGENIALIPGTMIPVAINSIHPEDGPTCPPMFEEFYNDNNGSFQQPVYDGFLDVFTAQIGVIPCEEYTLKIAISDVGDDIFDSAVFLEAESFSSANSQLVTSFENQSPVFSEGCENENAVFNFSDFASVHFPISYTIFGDAIMGEDYNLIASPDMISESNPSLNLDFEILTDAISEDFESVIIAFESSCSWTDTVEMYIADALKINVSEDTLVCAQSVVSLEIESGFEGFDSTFLLADSIPVEETNVPNYFPIEVSGIPFGKINNPLIIKSVCLNLKIRWADDLDIYLMAPNGQYLPLSTDNFANCDDYTNTCFTPTANVPINFFSGTTCGPGELSPNSGDFLPEGDWNDLIGAPVNGIWNLLVIDDSQGFTATFLDWSIQFSSEFLNEPGIEWSTGETTSEITVFPIETTTYFVTAQTGFSVCTDSVKVEVSGQGVLKEISATFCASEAVEIEVNGTVYNQDNPSGIEIFPGVLPNGCDSTIVIDLSFIETDSTELNEIIFVGEEFQVGNQTFNLTGNYWIPLINQFGCDSIVNLNLIVSFFTFELPENDSLLANDCDGRIYCLPIHPSAVILSDFIVSVNGESQPDLTEICGTDTAVCYVMSVLPGQGMSGPYSVDSWTVNSETHSFKFNDLNELIDSLQWYNPTGTWDFGATGNLTICSPANQSDYGNLVITQTNTGITSELSPSLFISGAGTQLPLPPGTHEVVITESLSGLSDTTFVTVIPPSSSQNQVIELNVLESLNLNLNSPIGCGNTIEEAENICPELSGESAQVIVFGGSFSATFVGISEGIDTACLVVCSDLGNCDTLFVEIIVTDTMSSVNDLNLENAVKIYPNPTENLVHVELDFEFSKGNYAILDATGKLIFRREIPNSAFVFETEGLASGIYFVQIETGEKIFYRKLIRK